MSGSILERIRDSLHDLYKNALNIFRSIFAHPSKVLFLGIDNAGKTTLLHKLREDVTNTYEPTRVPSAHEIEIGNMKANIMDLGGHTTARLAWSEFFLKCDGIVFIVDTADKTRFNIVREAWETVTELREQAIASNSGKPLPVAVLMNKIDKLPHTANTIQNDPYMIDYICQETTIMESPDPRAPVHITWTSLVEEGLEGGILDSFVWLDKMMRTEVKNEM